MTYLRTIQNQINEILNHAVKYYDLQKNPNIANNKMGIAKAKEMLFCTMDEYLKFSEEMKERPVSYYLYWTGIRCGELLALTRADFNLENKILSINKTFQIIKGEEMITSQSNRKIDLPEFLSDEMQDYFDSLYKLNMI